MKNISWAVASLVLCVAIGFVSTADPGAPLIFIFGDSTADVGTNNFLPTSMARADFPHNGIDFPSSDPTGRFSNGLNSADFLYPKPGGSGLLDITGKKSVLALMKYGMPKKTQFAASSVSQKNVVPLAEQIQQFSTVKSNLTAIKGGRRVTERSLFFISIGSNDLFGYYHSNSSIPKEEFLSFLLLVYESHLRGLIDLGARKFGIISVAQIGCCPSQRVDSASGGCLEDLNDLAVAFHTRLDALMSKLSSECKGIKYALGSWQCT